LLRRKIKRAGHRPTNWHAGAARGPGSTRAAPVPSRGISHRFAASPGRLKRIRSPPPRQSRAAGYTCENGTCISFCIHAACALLRFTAASWGESPIEFASRRSFPSCPNTSRSRGGPRGWSRWPFQDGSREDAAAGIDDEHACGADWKRPPADRIGDPPAVGEAWLRWAAPKNREPRTAPGKFRRRPSPSESDHGAIQKRPGRSHPPGL
jgi:hypothetical protein